MAVLGLIAGSGPLPFEVAEAAQQAGKKLAIAAIEDNTDPGVLRWADAGEAWFNAGQLGALIGFLKQSDASEVILAGAVSKRRILQNPAALRPDGRALALLARLGQSGAAGDDALLRALAEELEGDGLRVADSTMYLRDRMTREGLLAGPEPSAEVRADIELGLRVIASLGAYDIGQATVVKDGTVLAVEAVEGTDAAVRRAAHYGDGAVLVKAAKPTQDMRFDVPVIGPGTLELAEECKLSAIGLETARTLILERERSLEAATRAGISIVGAHMPAP